MVYRKQINVSFMAFIFTLISLSFRVDIFPYLSYSFIKIIEIVRPIVCLSNQRSSIRPTVCLSNNAKLVQL